MQHATDILQSAWDDASAACALYHLPGSEEVVAISGTAAESNGFPTDAMRTRGFLIAPFFSDTSTPTVLIPPQSIVSVQMEELPAGNELAVPYTTDETEQRTAYDSAFQKISDALRKGEVRKVVLSRRLCLKFPEETSVNPLAIFYKACHAYPRAFVALWHTPSSGMWLVCTPECLLEHRPPGLWHTMALAGTMTWEAGAPAGRRAYWSHKDQQEQKYVADYIRQRLAPFALQLEVSPTYPIRAGALAHLRTDFTFTMQCEQDLSALVDALHPTPAVCGIPTDKATQLIRQAEATPRRYYAGYSGPLNMDGRSHLYVTLRCAHFEPDGKTATLFAGGGILRESTCGTEWMETSRKMETILSLLRPTNT